MGRGIGYFAAMNASSIPGWVPAILRTAAVVALVSVLPAQDDAAAKGQGWIQMFNGRDLSGWTPKIPFDASAKLMEEELEKEQEAEAEALAGVLGQAQMPLDEAQRRLEQASSSSP